MPHHPNGKTLENGNESTPFHHASLYLKWALETYDMIYITPDQPTVVLP